MHTDPERETNDARYVVWDVETLRLSHEVRGGWRNIRNFGLAVAVTIDDRNVQQVWQEPDAAALIEYLGKFARVIGFNSRRFDLTVMSAYGPVDHLQEPTVDILESVSKVTGRRRGLSLQALSKTMFGAGKSLAGGTEAVQLWRSGRPQDRQQVIDYCTQDVLLTQRILEYGIAYGYVLAPIPDMQHGGTPVAMQVPVEWATDPVLQPGPQLTQRDAKDS